MRSFKHAIKFIFDFSVALTLFILLSPIFIACMVLLFFCNKGYSIFFTQERPGLNGKIFKIYKFQTMLPQRSGENLTDNERMTKVGSFMRKTSLDELPQLLNVLKGELSLVGPRPLLIEYLPLYNSEQRKRHLVKPGITGWAQINGRNAISWQQKFAYDVWYVENWSLMLDFKILAITFLKVVKRSGVNASSNVTMEKFRGN